MLLQLYLKDHPNEVISGVDGCLRSGDRDTGIAAGSGKGLGNFLKFVELNRFLKVDSIILGMIPLHWDPVSTRITSPLKLNECPQKIEGGKMHILLK